MSQAKIEKLQDNITKLKESRNEFLSNLPMSMTAIVAFGLVVGILSQDMRIPAYLTLGALLLE